MALTIDWAERKTRFFYGFKPVFTCANPFTIFIGFNFRSTVDFVRTHQLVVIF